MASLLDDFKQGKIKQGKKLPDPVSYGLDPKFDYFVTQESNTSGVFLIKKSNSLTNAGN